MEIDKLIRYFEGRLDQTFLNSRLAIESANESKIRKRLARRTGIRKLLSHQFLIEWILKLSGLYWWGKRAANLIVTTTNVLSSPRIPKQFDGYTILHLSDLHADISESAMRVLADRVKLEKFDVCVMTGDYRGRTWGVYEKSLKIMSSVVQQVQVPIYAVLGNHDSIEMVPALEGMGIRMLINEHVELQLKGEKIYLAGVEDSHFFQLDDVENVAPPLSPPFSILLSHSPELYRKAASAGFDVMLSGHTHGGQICLPGGRAMRLDCDVPREMGAGRWSYRNLTGYTSRGAGTSIVPVRLNCPPEITLHRLKRGS